MAGRKLKQPDGEDIYVDRATILKYFACNTATINKWRNEGMPWSEEKGYPVAQCFRWYLEREVAKRVDDITPEETKEIRTAIEREKLRQAEITTADMEGKTMLVDDGRRIMVTYLTRLRSAIKAAEGTYTTRIHGQKSLADTQKALSTAFDAILKEFDAVIEQANVLQNYRNSTN